MEKIKYFNKIINKAIKHYGYNEVIDEQKAFNNFLERYNFSFRNYKKNKYDFTNFIGNLRGYPYSTHILAKNLLFKNSERCWIYFERTALFWTMSHIADEWIDHIKNAFEYSLYVERKDLLNILIQKTLAYLNLEVYKNNKEHIKQQVYPSTQLIHFLVEKWLGNNPAKEKVLEFGKGYGIYQKLIDNWENYNEIKSSYWDELCEYHLNGIGVIKSESRESEEFLGSGLIPMELINLFKVRKELGLDIPKINHEFFHTPFATMPKIPTKYNENFDIIYQMVKKTTETQKLHSAEEIISYVNQTYNSAENKNFFLIF